MRPRLLALDQSPVLLLLLKKVLACPKKVGLKFSFKITCTVLAENF